MVRVVTSTREPGGGNEAKESGHGGTRESKGGANPGLRWPEAASRWPGRIWLRLGVYAALRRRAKDL